MNRKTLAAAALGLLLLGAVPLITSNSYYVHMAGTIMIYAILLYGLDIVVGYTGQVSLGHAGLFGVGSYTAGVLFMKLGAPLWVIIPASIAVTAAFGACDRPLPGHGDPGFWHHCPDIDQRDDLPH